MADPEILKRGRRTQCINPHEIYCAHCTGQGDLMKKIPKLIKGPHPPPLNPPPVSAIYELKNFAPKASGKTQDISSKGSTLLNGKPDDLSSLVYDTDMYSLDSNKTTASCLLTNKKTHNLSSVVFLI